MIEEKFLTKNRFAKMIEASVKEYKFTYMDAVIEVCTKLDVDLEDCKKFITPTIKEKIEAEAMVLNFLPRQNTLPID